MNIFLTFDYELFFGEKTGSVEKCLIHPTRLLIEISQLHSISMTYFVDAGMLVKMEEYRGQYPKIEKEYQAICTQLRLLVRYGNDIQLHIHPHWEKSVFDGEKWIMDTDNYYRFSNFNSKEQARIFSIYKETLERIAETTITAFRAGGWCIQPTSDFIPLFEEHGIRIDSSVFPQSKVTTPPFDFDFTNAPYSGWWRFSKDAHQEDVHGKFLEYPTTNRYYSAFFFWKLYILGRLNPSKHKAMGDGAFIPMKGRKKMSLIHGVNHFVSADGFFASELVNSLKNVLYNDNGDMVVLSHPKSLSQYSIKKLNGFVSKYNRKSKFKTFKDIV